MALFDKDGFLIVSETYSCVHFEPVPGRLFCMKECWYCKWARFGGESGKDDLEKGICTYMGESMEQKPEVSGK